MVNIIPFEEKYSDDFKQLNLEWLEKYFNIEPYDAYQLSNPVSEIINKGGYIYLAQTNERIVGTVALMKEEEDSYEMTKMSVSPLSQGKGISKLLIERCISLAKANNWRRIFLYSNTTLVPAINLYRKYGFREIELEPSSQYRRTNIKMELKL